MEPPRTAGPDPWSEAAVEQNRRWLQAFLLAATGDPAAAEDLVQDVFRIALEKRSSFRAGTPLGAWLRGIAKNCLLRHFERTRRSPILLGDSLDHLEQAAAGAEEEWLAPDWMRRRTRALQDCLLRLHDKARFLLKSRYLDGLSAEEVARRIGARANAVHVAVYRARAALAACLEGKLP
jgi:RNA polymerase sigma-70 factor (ECF subfamily)